MIICDFCTSPHVRWAYPAHSFIVEEEGGFQQESIGGWAACDLCSACIEDNKWDELLHRTVEAFPPFLRGDRDMIHLARVIHQRFRDARYEGEAGHRKYLL